MNKFYQLPDVDSPNWAPASPSFISLQPQVLLHLPLRSVPLQHMKLPEAGWDLTLFALGAWACRGLSECLLSDQMENKMDE